MGLDITAHKTRQQKGDSLNEKNYDCVLSEEKERCTALLTRDYMDCVRVLTEAETNKVDSDTYK